MLLSASFRVREAPKGQQCRGLVFVGEKLVAAAQYGAGAISAGVVKRSGKNWERTHWGRTISREPLGGSPLGATSTTIYLGHSLSPP